jgi:diaminopimelate decarboxylase
MKLSLNLASVLALSMASSSAAFAPLSSSGMRGPSTPSALNMANPDKSVFLTPETAKACIDAAGGTPLYAYSLAKLEESADACLAFPNAYGLTVRYAMKSCPNSSILKYFNSRGIHIDASSGYEVRRAMAAGIPAENISLSTQELPQDFADLVKLGVKVNAW